LTESELSEKRPRTLNDVMEVWRELVAPHRKPRGLETTESHWRAHIQPHLAFASRLLERGADIITVKELLGHSTVTVTMRYTHSNLGSKVLAVRRLESAATNQLQVAPKSSSSNPNCSQMTAKSQDVLELRTEGWQSGLMRRS
jgi:hypothetical protein